MIPILSVKDLRKIYPGSKQHVSVDSISFDLNKAEILGLLGPNGSGKTTTIQMLLGTLSATSGTILYFGKDFQWYRSELLQYISYASSYTSLPWMLTVAENLSIFGQMYGLTSKESARRFSPLLERFGIFGKKDARISSLSAGQITRLMIVKAFFVDPKVVLLDEPTASLDPDVADEICQFILEQREKKGLSILFTSHKMEEATELCDRVVFLKGGQIIANDLPKNLALSASAFRMRLTITDGFEQVIAMAEEKGLVYKAEYHTIEITLIEVEIPRFLSELTRKSIAYSNIKIEEPSLEDYFLQMARKMK